MLSLQSWGISNPVPQQCSSSSISSSSSSFAEPPGRGKRSEHSHFLPSPRTESTFTGRLEGGAMLQSRRLILPSRHRDTSDSDSTLRMTQQWRVEQKLQRHSGAAEIPSRSGTTSNKKHESETGIGGGFKPFISNMPMRLGSCLTSLEADCSFNPLQDVKLCWKRVFS